MALTDQEKRSHHISRLAILHTQRSSFEMTWRDIAQNISPRRGRFFQTDVEYAGRRKEQGIISGIPRRASRTLAAGLMAGITSPARPWFRLTVANPDLAELASVKDWLSEVAKRLFLAMAKSNFYTVLHMLYGDLGDFCTAAMVIESDDVKGMHGFSLPLGEYYLAQNDLGEVDTLYRSTALTVGQLVKKFGIAQCSKRVQQLYAEKKFDIYIYVIHVICPREEYDASLKGPKNMPWMSCWFETGGSGASSYAVSGIPTADVSQSDIGLLSEKGYEDCPFIAARWTTTGDDTYGTGPGWDALGDCKALQLYKRREAQALERMVDPPTYGPRMFGGRPVSLLPGALNWTDAGQASSEMRPVIVVPPQALAEIRTDIQEVEAQINATYFVDLWLALSQMNNAQPMTAREVSERSSEKLLQLGPVMERIEGEVLNPAVARCFSVEYRAGRIPPPPQELQGQPFRAEYLSIFAQAAKALASGGVQQLAGFLQNLAPTKPEIFDNFDVDKASNAMADALGVDPQLMVPADKVAALRAARAKQQAAVVQQQQAMAQATTAKTLSQANFGTDSALSRLGGIPANQAGGVQ